MCEILSSTGRSLASIHVSTKIIKYIGTYLNIEAMTYATYFVSYYAHMKSLTKNSTLSLYRYSHTSYDNWKVKRLQLNDEARRKEKDNLQKVAEAFAHNRVSKEVRKQKYPYKTYSKLQSMYVEKSTITVKTSTVNNL